MRKIIPSPTAFASFTGLLQYLDQDDVSLSRNLAENVDLPAIFRTLNQGVCPGLILSSVDDGTIVICSGQMVIMGNDIIDISFNTINLLNMSVSVSVSVSLLKNDAGGTAIRIPGSEWYLEALTQINT